METLRLEANGLAFHALAAGPEDGSLVLLLHGFPEFSRSWRHQLPALAAAGLRAVAPDLRGYGGTDKRGPYDVATLAADAVGLIDAAGVRSAVLVGHDWGGIVAWAAAHRSPERVDRLVILNAPHPATFAGELTRNPKQLLRSSYVFAYQVPWLPERLLLRNEAAAIARALRGGSTVRSAWPREELDRYREAFVRPGVASAALGYYRAAFRRPLLGRRLARAHPIVAPTLVLWGADDRFLGAELADAARLAPWFAPGNAPAVRLLDGVGHFVQNEAPERVNEALLDWLGASA